MFKYSIYGFSFSSDIELPELDNCEYCSPDKPNNSTPRYSVRKSNSPLKHFKGSKEPLWQNPAGAVWLWYSKDRNTYILEFPDLASFGIDPSVGIISYYANRTIPNVTVRHLLLDQVFPLVLSLTGQIVLHAGVVAINDKAAVLLGRSGIGKSTLTASFNAAGVKVLTDDSIFVSKKNNQNYQCHSNYPGIRLFSDSKNSVIGQTYSPTKMAHYTDKLRVIPDKDNFFQGEMEIKNFYEIGEETGSTDITICDLPFSQALIRLVESTFKLDIKSREALSSEMDRLTDLCISAPFKIINFPRDYSRLTEVREVIIADMMRE